MKRLGDSLTDEQFAWARKVELELGITISQAVKAIERNDREKIDLGLTVLQEALLEPLKIFRNTLGKGEK